MTSSWGITALELYFAVVHTLLEWPQTVAFFTHQKEGVRIDEIIKTNADLITNVPFLTKSTCTFLKTCYLLLLGDLLERSPHATLLSLTTESENVEKALSLFTEGFLSEKLKTVLFCYIDLFKRLIQSTSNSQKLPGRDYIWNNALQIKYEEALKLPVRQRPVELIEMLEHFKDDHFLQPIGGQKVPIDLQLFVPDVLVQKIKLMASPNDNEQTLFAALCNKARFERGKIISKRDLNPYAFYVITDDAQRVLLEPGKMLKEAIEGMGKKWNELKSLNVIYCPQVKKTVEMYTIHLGAKYFGTETLKLELPKALQISKVNEIILNKLKIADGSFGVSVQELPQTFHDTPSRTCTENDFDVEVDYKGTKIFFLKQQNTLKNYFADEIPELFLQAHLQLVDVKLSDEIKTAEDAKHEFQLNIALTTMYTDAIDIIYQEAKVIEPIKAKLFLQYQKSPTEKPQDMLSFTTLKKTGVKEGDILLLEVKDEQDPETITSENNSEAAEENIWNTTESYDINAETQTYPPATLNQLIVKVTDYGICDHNFIDTFLNTFRSFTTVDKILSKLHERCTFPATVSQETRNLVLVRVGVFIKCWIESETSTSTINKIHDFLETSFAKTPGAEAIVKKIQGTIMQKKSYVPTFATKPPVPIMTHEGELSLETLDPTELARQLTVATYNIFKQVETSELFHNGWSKPDCKVQSPHICELTDLFNRVAGSVSYTILSEPTLKGRARVMKRHVAVAQKLNADWNNFHLLLAYVSGLNSSCISRLKYTRERLDKKTQLTLSELERLTSMDNSFKVMREELSARTPPRIPPLGMFLIDLTFIEDGNPDTVDGKINFEKRALYYKSIELLFRCRNDGYNLTLVPEVQEMIANIAPHTEDELYSMSLEREPRNALLKDIK